MSVKRPRAVSAQSPPPSSRWSPCRSPPPLFAGCGLGPLRGDQGYFLGSEYGDSGKPPSMRGGRPQRRSQTHIGHANLPKLRRYPEPGKQPSLARTSWWERDGFKPEVSLAVLPTAQSETPVPPKSATVILAQQTGARSPCAAADAEPFRIAERPVSIRSSPLVANAEFSPQPPEVVGAQWRRRPSSRQRFGRQSTGASRPSAAALSGELGEETLDEIKPGAGAWGAAGVAHPEFRIRKIQVPRWP